MNPGTRSSENYRLVEAVDDANVLDVKSTRVNSPLSDSHLTGDPSTPGPAAPVPPTIATASGPRLTIASTNQGTTGAAATPVPI